MINLESVTVPPKAQGLWYRSGLNIDGRRSIDFSDAWYFQTENVYADARFLKTELGPHPHDGVNVNFARLGAFAGHAHLSDDDVMTWGHDVLDLRKNPATDDASLILWNSDDSISEGGRHTWKNREWTYEEVWTRVEDHTAVREVEISDDERRLHIRIGDYLIKMADHRSDGGIFIAGLERRIDNEWVVQAELETAA